MSFPVEQIRQDFPNLHIQVHQKPLVYLDNAATTFKPKEVIDAVNEHYSKSTANIHRGVHWLSEQATLKYEQARLKICQFIQASSTQEIIFTRGATEAINLVAQSYGRANIKAGDEILISHMEHHSNIVPWQMLCEQTGAVLRIIPIDDAGDIIYEEFIRLLNARTKILSIVYVSNSLGTINPVENMIKEAKKFGAKVLVDAAQAVTHGPINVQTLDCDFLVFSGHKLFGPTGIGVLYGKEKLLSAMPPYQGGGDMIASVRFDKTTYNTLPYKFEAGTPAIAEGIGLGAAIDYVNKLIWSDVMAHKANLLAYGTKVLSAIPGVSLIGTAKNKTSILSFIIKDIHPHDIGTLVDQSGVAIRTGHHCTQPVMERYNIPATARASLAMYNTTAEIDVLAQAIYQTKKVFGV